MTRIRAAQPQDAGDIVAIWNQIIRETTVTFTTDLKTVDQIAQTIRDQNAHGDRFLVLLDQEEPDQVGSVAGFACLNPFRGGPGYRHSLEHTIYLRDGARGRGAGPVLLQAVEQAAKAAGAHGLIGGVSGENEPAIRFHDRHGYTQVGRIPDAGRKFDRWIDLILMHKCL